MRNASTSVIVRRALGIASLATAAALLRAAIEPSPLATLDRHWLLFAEYSAGTIVFVALAAWLLRKRTRIALVTSAVVLTTMAALAHPVCVLIPATERPAFETVVSLDVRAARGEPFRRLDGEWYQCKSYVARKFFF